MKHYLTYSLFILLFLFSACSHISIVGFDKQANTVTLTGSHWDSQEDLLKKAKEYCGGSATLIKMEQRRVGTTVSTNVQGYNNSALGSSVADDVYQDVYTYLCK